MTVSELLNNYYTLPHYSAEYELVRYVDDLEEKLLLVNRTLTILLTDIDDCPVARERLKALLERLES